MIEVAQRRIVPIRCELRHHHLAVGVRVVAVEPVVELNVAFSQPFEIKANRNVRISASAPVDNSFVELDVDLVNEQSQEVESVAIPIEYYHGADSDGAWTEGSQSQDATVSSLPAGRYTLRVEGAWEKPQVPMAVNVRVEQNVVRGVNFACALIVLAIVPIIGIFRKITFESARWKDSMFGSSSSGSDSDE